MTDQQCPVSGCIANIGGAAYSGQPVCMQPWSGDPEAFKNSIRGCLFSRGASTAFHIRSGCTAADVHLICSYPNCRCKQIPVAIKAALESKSALIKELVGALEMVVSDIHEYETINNLAPSPGKSDCWQSVTRARATLQKAAEKS